METNTAIGAGKAIINMTIPEMRQILHPIRGGMRMLKVRVTGPTYELKDYLEHMANDKVYQVLSQSKPLKSKGTKKYFRVFSDVDKKTRIEARKRQQENK